MRDIADLPFDAQKLLDVILHGDRFKSKKVAKTYRPNGNREQTRRLLQMVAGKLRETDYGFTSRAYPDGAFQFTRAVKRRGIRSERKGRSLRTLWRSQLRQAAACLGMKRRRKAGARSRLGRAAEKDAQGSSHGLPGSRDHE